MVAGVGVISKAQPSPVPPDSTRASWNLGGWLVYTRGDNRLPRRPPFQLYTVTEWEIARRHQAGRKGVCGPQDVEPRSSRPFSGSWTNTG